MAVGSTVKIKVFLSTPSARRATYIKKAQEPDNVQFLSTPSARRATGWSLKSYSTSSDFYPRPPRGGRLAHAAPADCRQDISIHALREEGDLTSTKSVTWKKNFYPRPPRGGRLAITRHLLRSRRNFYPRPPRGGRQQKQRQNLYFLINYTTFCTNLEEL